MSSWENGKWLKRLGIYIVIFLFILIVVAFTTLKFLPKGQYCPLEVKNLSQDYGDMKETYESPQKAIERFEEIVKPINTALATYPFSEEESKGISLDRDMANKRYEYLPYEINNGNLEEANRSAYIMMWGIWRADYKVELFKLGHCVEDTTIFLEKYNNECYVRSYDPMVVFENANGTYKSSLIYLNITEIPDTIYIVDRIASIRRQGHNAQNALFNCEKAYKDLQESFEYQEPMCTVEYSLKEVIRWGAVITAFILGIMLNILLPSRQNDEEMGLGKKEMFTLFWKHTTIERLLLALLFSLVIFIASLVTTNFSWAILSSILVFVLSATDNLLRIMSYFWSLKNKETRKVTQKNEGIGHHLNIAEHQNNTTNYNIQIITQAVNSGTATIPAAGSIPPQMVTQEVIDAFQEINDSGKRVDKNEKKY